MDLRTDKTARAALYSALFRPRSVGLVGLSSDRQRPTGRVLDYLRRAGYGGDIYVVNPKRNDVQGARAYPSLRDLPEVPEHVYVLLGTRLAVEAVATCAEIGVKVVTVLADGFA
ncbi:MAG: CoA-binding protein, partial [Thermohalobaculum sp.]